MNLPAFARNRTLAVQAVATFMSFETNVWRIESGDTEMNRKCLSP